MVGGRDQISVGLCEFFGTPAAICNHRDGTELAADFVVKILLDTVPDPQLGLSGLPALNEKNQTEQDHCKGDA